MVFIAVPLLFYNLRKVGFLNRHKPAPNQREALPTQLSTGRKQLSDAPGWAKNPGIRVQTRDHACLSCGDLFPTLRPGFPAAPVRTFALEASPGLLPAVCSVIIGAVFTRAVAEQGSGPTGCLLPGLRHAPCQDPGEVTAPAASPNTGVPRPTESPAWKAGWRFPHMYSS